MTAELDRWGLIPDDSAGRPLALTPPGVLLRRLAALPGRAPTPADLLVLAQAPAGQQRAGRAARAPAADRPARDPPAARRRALDRLGRPRRLGGGRRAARRRPGSPGCAPRWRRSSRRRRAAARRARRAPPRRGRGAGRRAGRRARRTGSGRRRPAPQALRAARRARRRGGRRRRARRPTSTARSSQSLMATRDVPEEAVVTHPGIAIWGTLEARVQSADLVILGGLNEGIWPRLPGADPWLSRGMRRALGLPSPERRIGLSAHDFQQAMGARAGRADPRHPRRRGADRRLALAAAAREPAARPRRRGRGRARRRQGARRAGSLADAARLDRPAAPVPPARRPAPRPPAAARPAELSVTQVERLVRDPYGDLRRARCSACAASTRPAASPTR